MATGPGDRGQGEAGSDLLESEGIAQKVCDNRDLLAVSRGVASLPTLAVGAVLGNLDDSEITAIEEDPEIPLPSDKMYQLLYTWKTKGKGTHTWDHLLKCLKKLLSPEELMKRIMSRLRQTMAKPGTVVFTPSDGAVEAACKELENARCSDLDLECMSVKVSEHSVHVVGACLLLDEDLVKSIACSSVYPNLRSRIYNLFLKWKRKTGVHSTLPALLACLTWLENEPLLNGVKRYIVDTHRCFSILKAKLQVCSKMPIQETNERGTLSHNLSLEIPGDDIDDTAISSGWWPRPFEENFYDRHRAMMVCNVSRTQPLSFREEFATLQSEFSYLQSMVYENLKKRRVAVDTVQQFVNSLSVSQQENIPLFNEHMQEMIAHSSLKEIFGFLTRIGVWCFLNFRILEDIVKFFGSHDLQESITQYQEKVNRFKKVTKLSDFLQVWSGRRFHERSQGSEGVIPVLVKFEAAWRDCTLSEVAEKENFLANEFLLHKSVFQLANAKPGCVAVLWLVPFSVLTAVKAIIRKRLPGLRKANVEELIIGNLLFVQDGVVVEPVSYPHLYKYSIDHPEEFWGERAKKFLVWDEPFTRVMEDDRTRWFTGGKLNVTRSILDRHVKESPDRVALVWEPNDPGSTIIRVTYRELYEMTCRVANVLKSNGIAKGDVVTIYMPTMPLTVACMLACARIGAIHSVIFPALKDNPLQARIERAKSKAVITATTTRLGNSELHLKSNLDAALQGNEQVQHVFVASSPEDQLRELLEPSAATNKDPCAPYLKVPKRDIDLMKEISKASPECEPVSMESGESLFLNFTSGSSDLPKIITHSQAGYLLYAAVTHKYIFDYQPDDVFACVADFGWIMAHSYVVYGPLCNGATTVLFGSTATYPDPGRYWDMVERLKINQLYMSTSAVKRLMKCDEKHIRNRDLSSLRTIATGGEPLARDAWKWYHDVVGQMRCTVVDAWWQTETGGINIAPLPAYECSPLKPELLKPFFGVQPVIVNDKMEEVPIGEQGHLCLKATIPGIATEVDMDRDTFWTTYFDKDTGFYKTGDWAYCDSDGDYRITGRASDRVRVQGVWLDVPEIECLMTSHHNVKTATFVRCGDAEVDPGDPDPKTFVFVKLYQDESREIRRRVIKELTEMLERVKRSYVPQEFAVMNNEPETVSGKPAYQFMREVANQLERERGSFRTATEGGAFDDQLNPDGYIDKVQESKANLEIIISCH